MSTAAGARTRAERRSAASLMVVAGLVAVAGCSATPPDAAVHSPPASRAAPSALPSDPPSPAPPGGRTPVASPTPSATSSQPPSTGTSELVEHGNRESRCVALTFTLGYQVGRAGEVMRWLRDNEVPVSVYVIGEVVELPSTDAGREVVRIAADNPELFELGPHGFRAADFAALDAAQIRDEVRRTEEVLDRYAGMPPGIVFSPPGGAWDDELLVTVGELGYRYTVLWDVDPIDWLPVADGGPTADDIVSRVLGGVQGGSVVLLHLGGEQTLEALPHLVAGLRDRGYELVTVGDLLGRCASDSG